MQMKAPLLIFLVICFTQEKHMSTKKLREKLSSEERNKICCDNGMRCCKNETLSVMQMRAVLMNCAKLSSASNHEPGSFDDSTPKNYGDINKSAKVYEEEESDSKAEVTTCNRKIKITMRFDNMGRVSNKNQFIVIDHVYDSVTKRNQRLLNPYVIKLKESSVKQTYTLKFLNYVNSEAHEVVYNKHDTDYPGCLADTKKSACGVVSYKGNVVPFSQGFCCSCDALKNARTQPDGEATDDDESLKNFGDPGHLLDGVDCKPNEADSMNYCINLMEGSNVNQSKNQSQKTGSKMKINQQNNEFNDPSLPNYCSDPFNKSETIPDQQDSQLHDSLEQIVKRSKTLNNNQQKLINRKGNINKNISQQGYNIKQENLNKLADKTLKNNSRYNGLYRKNLYKKGLYKSSKVNLNDTCKEDDFEEDFGRHQILTGGLQIRGGQNCANRYTPPGLDQEIYHDSTHCLKFSDIWYGIYQLQPPVLDHSLSIQIFEKHLDECSRVQWRDVTEGKTIELNSYFSTFCSPNSTFAFTYKPQQIKYGDAKFNLNYQTMRILIPESGENSSPDVNYSPHNPGTNNSPDISNSPNNYPEVQGGPEEFLVVRFDKINLDGDQCNIPGVGYEAFFKQPNKCSVPRGTCLSNQPKHLWKHDKYADRHQEKGCFFLKNFGNVGKRALQKNSSGLRLQMEYTGSFYSTVEIEINADSNVVLRPDTSAMITEVYVDSTSASKTIITVKVTNSGLVSSKFYAKLSDCPVDLPNSFNKIQSKMAVIPPQHQHVYTLKINCKLPSDIFYCSAEVLNEKNELIALRRIKIQKSDRCFCIWHCLCACVGSADGLKCHPMSLEHYNAAGFQGGLPIETIIVHNTYLEDLLAYSFYVTLFIFLTLLLLGISKAIVGCCCCSPVGLWGLNILLDLPKRISCYYEADLRGVEVEYDCEGWPIHPATKERVRNISRATEFCINVIFFYLYPMVVLVLLFKRICCPYKVESYGSYYVAKERYGDNGYSHGKLTEGREICLGSTCPEGLCPDMACREEAYETYRREEYRESHLDQHYGGKIYGSIYEKGSSREEQGGTHEERANKRGDTDLFEDLLQKELNEQDIYPKSRERKSRTGRTSSKFDTQEAGKGNVDEDEEVCTCGEVCDYFKEDTRKILEHALSHKDEHEFGTERSHMVEKTNNSALTGIDRKTYNETSVLVEDDSDPSHESIVSKSGPQNS